MPCANSAIFRQAWNADLTDQSETAGYCKLKVAKCKLTSANLQFHFQFAIPHSRSAFFAS
jgi:hypothetical protein